MLLLISFVLLGLCIDAMPVEQVPKAPMTTPTPAAPSPLSSHSTPDDVFAFYAASNVAKRQESLSVPVSQLGPPKFPSDIPSCPKCEAQYPSLSSCMGAASVFANTTSTFNNPIAYIDVIRCACTDTFQAVFPQCVDCFQNTNQCSYLGTDPQGTGAGSLVGNIRNICGLGSALLGGVATANTNVASTKPTDPGTYTDVTSTGAGYLNEATGAIFPSGAVRVFSPAYGAVIFISTLLAVVVGGARVFV